MQPGPQNGPTLSWVRSALLAGAGQAGFETGRGAEGDNQERSEE